MSAQDKVERVLKEIHVTFSKCKTYANHPDKIIVDRRQFLELIDRLNMGIFDMLEEYEHTRQSRDKAEREFRKRGERIISDANAQAEDIYAASMLYTADMIGRIRSSMDKVNESMDALFRQFRRELRDEKNLLKAHESELVSQLTDLSDTKKYLSVLEDINLERRRRDRDEEIERSIAPENRKREIYTPASPANIKVNEQYFEKPGAAGREVNAVSASPAEKPDIIVNENAAYFKWKESQKEKGGETEATKSAAKPNAEETSGIAGESKADTAKASVAGGIENPEFPSEEALLQAVLADEMAADQAEREAAADEDEKEQEKEQEQEGSLLKRLFFGR